MTETRSSGQSDLVDACAETCSTSKEEFCAMFRAEFGYVSNALRRLGVPVRDLPDATHDVFVATYRRLDDYDRSRPLRPWLFGIAYRVASEHRRRVGRRREVQEDPAATSEPEAEGDPAETLEARRLVIAALQLIEIERRPVFIMHDIDGHSMPDIAAALGIPLNTGYSRLRLAREEFRKAVAQIRQNGGEP